MDSWCASSFIMKIDCVRKYYRSSSKRKLFIGPPWKDSQWQDVSVLGLLKGNCPIWPKQDVSVVGFEKGKLVVIKTALISESFFFLLCLVTIESWVIYLQPEKPCRFVHLVVPKYVKVFLLWWVIEHSHDRQGAKKLLGELSFLN